MKIKSISLKSYRNYSKKNLDFSKSISLLLGKNGTGKTNLLEAISMLATGKSIRAKREQEMILYGQELARVSGDINGDSLEVVVTTGEVQGERVPKKKYLVNGASKRKMDFVGRFRVVMFRPEDIELVLGSPSNRRNYLDSVLEQVDREYRRSNLSYQKGVRQRNKVLERIREGEADRQQLLFWNKLVIKNGEIVSLKRKEFIEFVNHKLKEKKSQLQLLYDESVMSEARLSKYAVQEVAVAKTLVGPHRDDFLFITRRKGKAEKDLSIFGSRGEQRMAVFEVKLSELEFADSREGFKLTRGVPNLDRPVLLLDDVFSELDREHRREVFELLNKQQTIITTSDEGLMPKKFMKKVKIISL